MNKTYRLVVYIFIIASLLFTITGCGVGKTNKEAPADKKLVIKFSHVVAEATPKGRSSLKFKEIVEKNSGGRIEVQVFPSSSLYGDKEEIEQLKANNVQFIAPSVTKLVQFQPAFQLVDMPFLFRNDQAAYNFYNGEHGKKLMKSLESQGMTGLAWWPNGSKNFTNSKKPLKSPEDFNGLKFRTQSGGVLEAQFRALGAASKTLVFAEVYTALNNGIVDGQENTFSNIETQNYIDVQKYITVSGHGRLDYVVLTNTTFWNSLSAEEKKILEDAIKETTVYATQLAEEENKNSYNKLKNSGKMQFHYLTDEERVKFIKALAPVYEAYTDKIGREYIEAARNSR